MSRVRQCLKSSLASVLPKSLFLAKGPHGTLSGNVEIALTFDDGPHPEYTPQLLDALASAGAKATFFVIGGRAAQYPILTRRIVEEGHELGNHTWTHSEPSRTSTAQFLDEVARTRNFIQDLTGRDCRLMRPPKGSLTVQKALGLWLQKQTIVLWNVDPKDFAMADSSAMLRWFEDYQPQSGDVVLLHDNHPHAIAAVKRLASERHTMRIVTLSHWLGGPTELPERLRSCPIDCEVANVG